MVTNCILGIFRLRRRMRSDFAQDDRGERPFQFRWSWRCRQFVKELFAVELYPALMFGISQKFPDAAWLQSASSGSFDYVVACAPTSLKMTWGQRAFQFRWSWRCRQFIKELFAVELYPALMFGISQKFPAAAWLQSASSGSFDCVIACAPTSLKMTSGKAFSISAILAMPGDFGNARQF